MKAKKEKGKEKEIARIIELKKLQEEEKAHNEDLHSQGAQGEQQKKFSAAQQQELMRLLMQHKEYLKLSAAEAQEKFDSSKTQVCVENEEDVNPIVADYNELFRNKDGSYKEGYVKPNVNGKEMELTFPTEKAEIDFLQDQAGKGRKFMVIDAETNTVLAYSDGKKLFHAGGAEFKMGDKYQSSSIPREGFVIPEQESSTKLDM